MVYGLFELTSFIIFLNWSFQMQPKARASVVWPIWRKRASTATKVSSWNLTAKIAEHRTHWNINPHTVSEKIQVSHWLYKRAICFCYIDPEMSYVPNGAKNIWKTAHWSKFVLWDVFLNIR